MGWNRSLVDGPIAIEDDDGYHLNIAPEALTLELEPFRVYPETPAVVWAGDGGPEWSTVFLRFADEAEAIEYAAHLVVSDS